MHAHHSRASASLLPWFWLSQQSPAVLRAFYRFLKEDHLPVKGCEDSGLVHAFYNSLSSSEALQPPPENTTKSTPALDAHWQWQDASPHHHLLHFGDPQYPPFLRFIDAPPLLLWGIGNIRILKSLQIAIVGSRDPTPLGAETAHQLAFDLAISNWTITSGLARGIDSAAHWGALAASGPTIAVLGTGICDIYPKQNEYLAQKIISQQGLLLSEFGLKQAPVPTAFPRRNRIISGLCLGTVVVEARLKSGSLITAQHAAEQGRDVFAVPGAVTNPNSQGCHQLLQEGAKLTLCAQDILDEYASLFATPTTKAVPGRKNAKKTPSASQALLPPVALPVALPLAPSEQNLLNCIDFHPTSVQQIAKRNPKSTPAELQTLLSLLEIHGYIKMVATGYYLKLR